MTIRVVLADDQALVRAGFRVLLETEDGFEVCGEANDGAEAVALAQRHRPDVVVMDVRMPGVDGLEATRRITGDPELAAVKVLVLTTFDVDAYVYDALRAGASGFLLKDTEPIELLRALRVVAEGEALLAPTVTSRLIAEFVSRPENRRVDTSAVAEVTEREREVLALVAGGLSNEEIAAQLVISKATARTHVSRIMSKVGARDRAQLVVLAYESGLVSPGSAG
ncbi:MAG TPA: response regulator transcription factor [Amycolatopsis sp.]|nr:response regulator transcription factor [Amycolatopsis sp.]